AHLYEVPEPLSRHRPDVPADLEAVVLRCLAKDPNARFPDAETLTAALSSCAAAGQWSARGAAHELRAPVVAGKVAAIAAKRAEAGYGLDLSIAAPRTATDSADPSS